MLDDLSGSNATSVPPTTYLNPPSIVASLKQRGVVAFVAAFSMLGLVPDLLMLTVPMPAEAPMPWDHDLAMSILILVIVVPPAETFLLQWLPLRIARAAGAPPWLQFVLGSIPFGLLHFEFGVQTGISALFGGVLLTLALMTWERDSLGKAFLITTAIHALHNAIALILPSGA